MRRVAQIQRDFAGGRDLAVSELEELLYGKWFEPVTAILGAMARLAGYPGTAAPSAPPLVLEGLLALDLDELDLPLPEERLDFRGPWTTWRGG